MMAERPGPNEPPNTESNTDSDTPGTNSDSAVEDDDPDSTMVPDGVNRTLAPVLDTNSSCNTPRSKATSGIDTTVKETEDENSDETSDEGFESFVKVKMPKTDKGKKEIEGEKAREGDGRSEDNKDDEEQKSAGGAHHGDDYTYREETNDTHVQDALGPPQEDDVQPEVNAQDKEIGDTQEECQLPQERNIQQEIVVQDEYHPLQDVNIQQEIVVQYEYHPLQDVNIQQEIVVQDEYHPLQDVNIQQEIVHVECHPPQDVQDKDIGDTGSEEHLLQRENADHPPQKESKHQEIDKSNDSEETDDTHRQSQRGPGISRPWSNAGNISQLRHFLLIALFLYFVLVACSVVLLTSTHVCTTPTCDFNDAITEETRGQDRCSFGSLAICNSDQEFPCVLDENNSDQRMVTDSSSAVRQWLLHNGSFSIVRSANDCDRENEGATGGQRSIPGVCPGGEGLTNTCGFDNWFCAVCQQLDKNPRLHRVDIFDSYLLLKGGNTTAAKEKLCPGQRDFRQSEAYRILGILEPQLRHERVYGDGCFQLTQDHVMLSNTRDGRPFEDIAEAVTHYETRRGCLRFERPPVFLSLRVPTSENFREDTDRLSSVITFYGERYYLASVTYLILRNSDVHHLTSRIFEPNGTYTDEDIPHGSWWYYANTVGGRLVPFTSPPDGYTLNMLHYVRVFQEDRDGEVQAGASGEPHTEYMGEPQSEQEEPNPTVEPHTEHSDKTLTGHTDELHTEHLGETQTGHMDGPYQEHFDEAQTAHMDDTEHLGEAQTGHTDDLHSEHLGEAQTGHTDEFHTEHSDETLTGHTDDLNAEHLGEGQTGHTDELHIEHSDEA